MASREEIDLIVNAVVKGFDKVNKDVAAVGKSVKESGDQAKKAGNRWTELSSKLNVAKQAYGQVSAAVGKAIQFAKESIALHGIQAKAEAQLAATIKSTGSAAGVTAKEMREYASALQNQTTFGDEAIIGAESLLLTFTNIGGPVLKDATATVLDMSQALGQDLKSSSVQLGKALNDPITGITALSRVGVSFTEQQKDQIKTMTEMGDVAGAQRLILAELNKEFGGSAAAAVDTYDGKLQQLSNTYGDLQEEIGQGIVRQGGFVESLNKTLGAITSNTAVWNDLQAALDDGFISQERLTQAHDEGNEALAALADEYLEWIDLQDTAIAAAESSDRVLTGLVGTYGELVSASELSAQAQEKATQAQFGGVDAAQMYAEANMWTSEQLFNAAKAENVRKLALEGAQGAQQEGLSLTERINAEIARLNAQPKQFDFNLDVHGLESLKEAVRLAGQMGGGIDFDPFAGSDDVAEGGRPSSNTIDDALDRGGGDRTFFGPSSPVGNTTPAHANFASGVSNFRVPPGFPNDSFKMGVSSGEVVNVASNGGGGGVNINGPLIGSVSMNPGENVNSFAQRVTTMVSQQLGGLN